MIVFFASINADFVEQTPTQVSCRSKAGQLAGFVQGCLTSVARLQYSVALEGKLLKEDFGTDTVEISQKRKSAKMRKTNSGSFVVSMDGIVCRCLLPLLSMERLQMREKKKDHVRYTCT